jgi:putative nucleotidyltransferase with HDIG domain
MTQNSRRDEILSAIGRAPMLSTGAIRIIDLAARADHSLEEIIDQVRNDAPLTAKLLKVVNSPIYGLLEPATSVERAVSYLGENTVVSIILEDTLGPYLSQPLEGYQSAGGDLWRHDLRCAIAAKEIALLNRSRCQPDTAFTAGLLHDIGKSVLSGFLRDEYLRILDELTARALPDYTAGEREHLGIDHAEVGAILAQNWKLPEIFRTVIRHHHDPAQAAAEFRTIVYAVHLGDILAMMAGYGTGADNLFYRLDQHYVDWLSFGPEHIGPVMLTVEEIFTETVQAMQVTQPGGQHSAT